MQKHLYVSPPIKPVLQEIKEGFLHHVCDLCRGEKKTMRQTTAERDKSKVRELQEKGTPTKQRPYHSYLSAGSGTGQTTMNGGFHLTYLHLLSFPDWFSSRVLRGEPAVFTRPKTDSHLFFRGQNGHQETRISWLCAQVWPVHGIPEWCLPAVRSNQSSLGQPQARPPASLCKWVDILHIQGWTSVDPSLLFLRQSPLRGGGEERE